MKKTIIVALVLILCGTFAFSAQQKFVVGAGAGVYYDAAPVPEGALGFLAALFNLRAELYANFSYKFIDMVGVGAEVGFAYISTTIGEDVYSLIDLPVRALATLDFKLVTLQPYLGLLFTTASSSGGGAAPFVTNFEAGARLTLGSFTGLYVEAGYVMGPVSYPRFGLGFQLKLIGF